MSIKVENVTKVYDTQHALQDVSFEVNAGEVVGFLGPNGAGKSTMMKIITCFIPKTSGRVSICGYDVDEQSIQVRENVGYLPEHNPLYLDMYVKEYLEFIAGLHHIKNVKQRISEMLAITGLDVEQKKKIGALSKGYRQRVGLAQALIHDPKVLILDEPTTGLDPNQLVEIRSLITEIGKSKTVLLSTHIMQEVEAICSRVIIINKGQIVANDSTSVLQNSSNKQMITVEFDKPVEQSSLSNIQGVRNIYLAGHNVWKIETSGTKDIRAALFNYAVSNNITILTLQVEEQKLEDVFKSLTR